MIVAVLGGTGFVGRKVVERLLESGHNLRVLGRRSECSFLDSNSIKYFSGTLSDTELLKEVISEVDIVVHLVSSTIPSTSALNPKKDIYDNLIGSINVVQAMEHCSVKKIIYLSSGGAVYGDPAQLPVTEGSVLNPVSSYGIVKASIEKYLLMFYHQGVIEPLILRPSNLYGPGQDYNKPLGLITNTIFKALTKKAVDVWGDGSSERDYIFIDDLVDVIECGILKFNPKIYNVGSGDGYSVKDIIELIETELKIPVNVNSLPARKFDVKKIYLNIDAARHDFDWTPKTSIKEGMQKTYQWIKGQV